MDARQAGIENRGAKRRVALPTPCPTSHGDAPDLTLIVGVWDRLPEDVRSGIVAMVRASV